MAFKRNRSNSTPVTPDLEKGSSKFAAEQTNEASNRDPYARDKQATDGDPRPGGEQNADDDSDNNDKFWKLFQEEAAAEAKWKVGIWKTELDSLLVFAGLFAAVVSAFLIDLRLHLRPDLQLIALNQIAHILTNDTSLVEFEKPTITVRAVGYLWYGSLVATLIGALWGVLAKGWLGQILREPPNNPADRALARWRRDRATKNWHMESVITAVPLLTQAGLAMFLSGFVVQSFGDDHGIGVEVLVCVFLGALAYGVFTFLPLWRPECPYQTPLTNFLRLSTALAQFEDTDDAREAHDADRDSKIKILVSRLNRSANDEIFCSAAAMLDAKLESHDSEKWYSGVEKQATGIADALSVRLKSFSRRVQQLKEAPSALALLKDTATSGINGQALVGNLYSPIEQGVACLRVLLKSIEASMYTAGDKSPWIKQDVDRQWRAPDIFPADWRLLSLSIHITRLVAKKVDYDEDDVEEVDWENMISKTFSDLTLRAISGASACRGLLHGEANLKRICAVGLAMFIEVEATTPSDGPKLTFLEKDPDSAFDAGKAITESLWSELVKIWKNRAIKLLTQARNEGEEGNSALKLLDHELYESDIKASISTTILNQLENESWATRKQAVQMLTTLAEHEAFQDAVETSGAIAKVVGMLEDADEYVRAAVIKALATFSEKYHSDALTKLMKMEGGIMKLATTLADDDLDVRTAAADVFIEFSKHESYLPDIKSSIPAIIRILDDEPDWRIREQTVQTVKRLSEFDVLQETLNAEGMIPKLITKLEDNDSDVRAAATAAVLALSAHEPYQDGIKSSISMIINQMDNTNWSIREKTVQILVKLAESELFRETLNIEGIVPKLVDKLNDDDVDVRTASAEALRAFSTSAYSVYHAKINLSIPTIIAQLDNTKWATRREAIRILAMLSEQVLFQEIIKMDGAVEKLISKFEDEDEDVRMEAIKALVALGAQSYFKETLNAENAISNLFGRLSDRNTDVRFAAVQAMSTLSSHEIYNKDIKSLLSISSFVQQLSDESWSTKQQAIQILTQLATNADFQAAMNAEKTVSILANMFVNDRDEDVRATAAQALSVFGAQDIFQKSLRSEKVILKLAEKLSDPFGSFRSRSAARSTMLDLSEKAVYQNDIKATIPTITKRLEDENWVTRQQAIQILEKLSERAVFQETMKTEMSVAKLVGKLDDKDERVRAAAVKALSTLGTKGSFQDRMKSERVISKLVGKFVDESERVRSAVYNALLDLRQQEDVAGFLKAVMSALDIVDKPARMEVYKLLSALKANDTKNTVQKQIDTSICKLLTQTTTKDLAFALRTIAILSETADQGLRGEDLKEPTPANKSARDAIDNVVRLKLVYDKNSPDRNVVSALAQLAKHDVFYGCMKSTIPGLTEAVSSSDRIVRNAAIDAVSALSKQDEFRLDLIPAIQKLIQQLSVWKEEDSEEYPLNLVETMSSLVLFKEFRAKLKSIVPILMDQLPHDPKDVRIDGVTQDNDNNEIAFYKATCKLISDLCEIEIVGKDLVPKLTCVLANMDASLTEDLLHLVTMLIEFGRLTMNDRIALASSLRIASQVPDTLDVQVCKLNIAALLDEAHKPEHPLSEYSSFLGAVLGSGNDTVKTKLSTLVQPVARNSNLEIDM